MSDEVTAAKRKRWVRQLAEALAEVFRAEVPEPELSEVAADFQLAFGLAVQHEFRPHEDSPTVAMHMHEAGVACPECDR